MELSKIRATAASAIISCAATPFSMALAFFLLDRNFFTHVDILRLSIICIALSFPFFAIALIILLLHAKEVDVKEDSTYTIAGLIVNAALDIVLLFCYLSNTGVKQFFKAFVGLAFTAIIISIVVNAWLDKSEDNKK